MKRTFAAVVGGMLMAAALLTGCRPDADVQQSSMFGNQDESGPGDAQDMMIPEGTPFDVRLTSTLGTADAQVGDEWEGVLVQPLRAGGDVMLDEGSVVHGVVRRADPPAAHQRATLELVVTGIEQDGEIFEVTATTEPIVAGTSRARHIGAIAGGAAAGAILGKVVTGSGKGAVVGGVLGGAAGHVLSSRNAHLELRPGTVISFTVSERVAAR